MRVKAVRAGLGTVLMLGVSTLATSGAQATPEFRTCVRAMHRTGKTDADGEYADSACSQPDAGGRYKLGAIGEAKHASFAISGAAVGYFGWVPLNGKNEPSFPGTQLSATTCTTEKGKGTFEPFGMSFTLERSGCKDGTRNCKTEGALAKRGVITSEQLTGTLVDLPNGRIGMEVRPTTPGSETLTAYNCEGIDLKENGAMIGEVQGGQTEATKELKLWFAAGGDGIQQQWNYPTPAVSEEEGEAQAWQWTKEALFEGVGAPLAPRPDSVLLEISGESPGYVPTQIGGVLEIRGETLRVIG